MTALVWTVVSTEVLAVAAVIVVVVVAVLRVVLHDGRRCCFRLLCFAVLNTLSLVCII